MFLLRCKFLAYQKHRTTHSAVTVFYSYTIEKESAMKITELPKTDIDNIKHLWELLNRTHLENSNNWKNHF